MYINYKNYRSAFIYAILLTAAAHASDYTLVYTSTAEIKDAITDVYNALLKKGSIFDPSVDIKRLEGLGKSMDEYVMKKQGILYGKKSSKKPNNLNTSDNIFDIWIFLFESFSKLINVVKITRASKTKDDTDARRFLAVELNTHSWQQLGIDQMKKIRDNTMLDGKKKLADVITLFSENTIKLIEKIKQDIKNL